nr:cation/H(+) antiporter 2-like isoform X1 [Ipomoea batatas]GMC67704.1 cation/H(+) antiporter 2-like isoform X1 [Ipomoea batatas]
MLGPSGLSLIPEVKSYFLRNFVADYYEFMAVLFRIIIMFLIGLEMDFPYFLRKLRQVGIIACGSSLMCTFFAAAITSFVYQETTSHGSAFMMGLMITIILASTASPVVIRLAADLKFATSDIGRMAISSALINDAYGVVLLFAISKTRQHYSYATWVFLGFLYLFTVGLVVVVNKYVANWMNRRNRNQKYLKNAEMFGLLAILYIVAMSLELMGFSSLIFSFLIGSMFPRGGKAARTLLIKLTYPVHNFILPIYFGYLGFKANVAYIDSIRNFCVVFFIMLLSFGGKIVGTLAACYHLKIPYYEGVLMAFLMNLKGHVDLLALTIGSTNKVSIYNPSLQ